MKEALTAVEASGALQSAGAQSACPVHSYDEWSTLEEVIVGRLDGAVIPPNHISVTFNVPRAAARALRFVSGFRYPAFLVRKANEELEGFVRLLEAEGVKVRRPDPIDGRTVFKTPEWKSRGFCTACPRDGFLVIGNEIIETPMAWRSRYFEAFAYRRLFKEYFAQGARWTSAPKPQLSDALYNEDYSIPREGEAMRYVVNEFEPVFDAADFVRCGRDLFVIRSNVTNRSGIEWLRRHLGPDYRIHEIQTRCRQPMHIDSSFVPLAPGQVLVNPDWIDVENLPHILKRWDILVAPRPDPFPGSILNLCSHWINMNVLSIDTKRVVVEESQKSMIRALKDWGFDPIPCAFRHYSPFGGAFHCATLDIRRKGGLASYF